MARQAAAMSPSVHPRSNNDTNLVMCATAKLSTSHAAQMCKAGSSKQHTSSHIMKLTSALVYQ